MFHRTKKELRAMSLHELTEDLVMAGDDAKNAFKTYEESKAKFERRRKDFQTEFECSYKEAVRIANEFKWAAEDCINDREYYFQCNEELKRINEEIGRRLKSKKGN